MELERKAEKFSRERIEVRWVFMIARNNSKYMVSFGEVQSCNENAYIIHYTRLWSCLALCKTFWRVDIKSLSWLKLIECPLNRHLLCDTLNFGAAQSQWLIGDKFWRKISLLSSSVTKAMVEDVERFWIVRRSWANRVSGFTLKRKKELSVRHLFNCIDVMAVLPTGFGKA